jgi:uncharacterized membrane protein
MMHVSTAAGWAVCGVGTVAAVTAMGWAAGTWKRAAAMLPACALMFLLVTGRALTRERPVGDLFLLYADAIFPFTLVLVLLKRLLRSPAYLGSDPAGFPAGHDAGLTAV